MPRFFQVHPDARVRDLAHSTRLTKEDRKALREAYGNNPILAFALLAVHPVLRGASNAGGRVTSRTLRTLKVKSKAIADGSLLSYTLGDSVLFLDEVRNMFYAPSRVASSFVQALSQRVERTMLPKKKREKAAAVLLRVATALLANVTQSTRAAVDSAMSTWNGDDIDHNVLQHALEVHAEWWQAVRGLSPVDVVIASKNEIQAKTRVAPRLRSEYKRMCALVRKHLKNNPPPSQPPNLP